MVSSQLIWKLNYPQLFLLPLAPYGWGFVLLLGINITFLEGCKYHVSMKVRKKNPQRCQTFCIYFDSQQWVRRVKISPASRDLREATHIMGDTACIPVHLSECPSCSCQRSTAWSMNLSTGNWFLNVKFNTLNSTRQTRETESRFNIAFGYHSSNPSAIIYPKAHRAAQVTSKILFPWWIFQGHS